MNREKPMKRFKPMPITTFNPLQMKNPPPINSAHIQNDSEPVIKGFTLLLCIGLFSVELEGLLILSLLFSSIISSQSSYLLSDIISTSHNENLYCLLSHSYICRKSESQFFIESSYANLCFVSFYFKSFSEFTKICKLYQ